MKKPTNENIVFTLVAISAFSIFAGLLLPTISSWFDKPALDYLAVYFWVLCVVPFMSLQFFLPAGIYVSLISDFSLFVKSLIYFILMPVANVWFFFWLGTICNFLPQHESIGDVLKLLFIYSGILFLSLLIIGLFVRYLRVRLKR